MANPNIVNVSTINGKTAVANVTTVTTNVISNSVASDKIFKLNSIYIVNVEGGVAGDITIDLFRDGTPYYLAYTLSVPADALIDLVSKAIYLEEGDSVRVTASANGVLHTIMSYEEIS